MIPRFIGISGASTILRSTLVVLILVALLTGFAPGVVLADQWDRYDGWKVTAFELKGMPDNIPTGIKSQLALNGQRKLKGMVRPPFKAKLLAEDLARIRLLLSKNGYPLAKTFPVIDAKAESRQLALLIEVKPGPATRIGKLELTGWPSRVDFPDTSRKGIIHENMLFQDEAIEEALDFLHHRLLDSGYESARIVPNFSAFAEGRIDIQFDVDEGIYSVIDSVVVEGCSPDLIPLALRVLDIKPGMEYSGAKVRRAALELRGTQLFDQVNLGTSVLTPGHLLLNAEVNNARMRTWQAGVGSWSDNPWLLRLGWTHNNLFKNGVGFSARGIYGEYQKSFGTDVFWLGWLTPRSRTTVGLMMEDETEDSYHSREERLDLIQSFRPNLRDIWKIGLSVSLVDVETFTPDFEEAPDAQGPMLEIWSDWKWDRTDIPLRPTRGYYFKVSATVAPPIPVVEFPYSQVQFDGSKFLSLSPKIVLGGRLRAGGSWTLSDQSDLLANRRFYAGGYNSMRGYGRRRLGPLDSAGEPRGGQFVALAGLELRFPLFWFFDGAAFIDSGQVWREAQDVQIDQISGAVGVALDLVTPLGPLRVNYTVNAINQSETEPRSIWLFGIGYPW
jgi:outer membrane protein assembly factor BamA